MKVLFLDFDGVINSRVWIWTVRENGESWGREGGAWIPEHEWEMNSFDRVAVERLNRIIEETGAVVVVSSSWRIGRTSQRLAEILIHHGFRGQVAGKTASIERTHERVLPETEPVQRWEEIRVWLNHHPEVTKFAVIDDGSDMEGVRENFVQTTWEFGLQDDHVDQLIELLR